ncbi:hypothetical protein F4780DRAFT_748519 [Xylariomycetidae sp. FL0641]|nr:hypothetical protein F4780DRAFT_748519 [Xylariomycetidae sp. FL0641]
MPPSSDWPRGLSCFRALLWSSLATTAAPPLPLRASLAHPAGPERSEDYRLVLCSLILRELSGVPVCPATAKPACQLTEVGDIHRPPLPHRLRNDCCP